MLMTQTNSPVDLLLQAWFDHGWTLGDLRRVHNILKADPWLLSTNSNHYLLSMGRPIASFNWMFGDAYHYFTAWWPDDYWRKQNDVDSIIIRLVERIRQWLRRALHNAYERTHRPLRISDEQQRQRRVQQVLGKRSRN